MYFSRKDAGVMRRMLDNWPSDDAEIVVASGGFDPAKSMPVCLDLGTNNEGLRAHDYYHGADEPRLQGEAHMAVVEEFCLAIKDKWPNCLIQFEDFRTEDAFRILERMRHKVLCFNDDIQGTGATILAGLINALRSQGTPAKEARIIFFGAGLSEQKQKFAQIGQAPCDDLAELIARVKPHALFGLSGFGPVFTREHIELLCEHIGKPIVFPLSNPTSKAEITAFDAYTWSKGKCLFAAGSPFDPVTVEVKTYKPGQGNNMFIFPGVGFAAVSVRAKYVPDSFFIVAARALAEVVPEEDVRSGTIYPSVSIIRDISRRVAVAKHAYEIEVAQLYPKPGDMDAFITERMYFP